MAQNSVSEAWVVSYIGCMECGVPSSIIGVCTTEKQADEFIATCEAGGDSWHRHGGDGYIDKTKVPVGVYQDPSRDKDDD